MPIYEYRCENGHTFEVIQSMSADPVTACEECGAPVERVFNPVAIHFKGSGFHNTDYKKAGQAGKAGKEGESSSSSEDGKSDSKSDSGSSDKKSDSKKSDSGSATKAASD
jgi:putative FmdB family regulatory protein